MFKQIGQTDTERERDRAIKSCTHARLGGRGREWRGREWRGGREGWKASEEVLREETHPLCSGGRNGCFCTRTLLSVTPVWPGNCYRGARMWIHALLLGLVVVSCSGKFDRNPSGSFLTSTIRLELAWSDCAPGTCQIYPGVAVITLLALAVCTFLHFCFLCFF